MVFELLALAVFFPEAAYALIPPLTSIVTEQSANATIFSMQKLHFLLRLQSPLDFPLPSFDELIISFIIAYVNSCLVYIVINFILCLKYYIIIKKRKDILRMKSRNTFKKGSCELLVLHILNKKGDCYGYELGQIIRDMLTISFFRTV